MIFKISLNILCIVLLILSEYLALLKLINKEEYTSNRQVQKYI